MRRWLKVNILASVILVIGSFIAGRVYEYRLNLKECENCNNKYPEKWERSGFMNKRIICNWCGKLFYIPKQSKKIYCCKRCERKANRSNREQQN